MLRRGVKNTLDSPKSAAPRFALRKHASASLNIARSEPVALDDKFGSPVFAALSCTAFVETAELLARSGVYDNSESPSDVWSSASKSSLNHFVFFYFSRLGPKPQFMHFARTTIIRANQSHAPCH